MERQPNPQCYVSAGTHDPLEIPDAWISYQGSGKMFCFCSRSCLALFLLSAMRLHSSKTDLSWPLQQAIMTVTKYQDIDRYGLPEHQPAAELPPAALLNSAHPVEASSSAPTKVTIEVEYEFHLKKLQEPEMRGIIEEIIAHLLDKPVVAAFRRI